MSQPDLRALRQLLEAIPAAAYICDPQGRITMYNEGAVALWGRVPTSGDDQWCGSYRMHWPDGTSMPLNQCPMAIALKTSRSLWGMDAVIERPDGTRRDVLANPQLLHDSTGSIFGALNILVDITERKQKEEASGRLAAIVESSDDAIVGKTLEGIVTSWNRSAERIFGYTAAEAVGQHISLIIPHERLAEEDYVLGEVQRGNRIEHFETERQCKDGRRVKISLTVSPIKDASGHIIGASKIARDITEQKRAEDALRESEERFKAIFNQVVSGIAQTDLEGRFVLVNDRYCQIVGRTREELMALRMQDITHPADLQQNVELFERLVREGVNFEIEKRYVRPDGSDMWVHNSVSVVTESGGRPLYAIADVVDISERKRAEELIRRSNTQLKQANENLQHFAYSMTHDLQEPLRMMACYSDLVVKRFKGKLDDEADTFLQFIREGALRMQMLIQDLLQFAQLELSEDMAKEPVDCAAALRVALSNLRSAIEESGAVVTSGPLPMVFSQDVYFVQLFQNLVGNAIKYRREEPPRIHVAAEQREGEWLFSIRDNGIGIEPQYATDIFGLFKRLRKDSSGTGIGLAICAKVVERHGGRIWVESEVERGSTFFFTVPVAESAQQRVSTPVDTLVKSRPTA